MHLEDHLQQFSQRNERCLKRILRPLTEACGISYFSYFTLADHGKASLVISNAEFCEYYVEGRHFETDAMLCHPSRAREGMYLWSTFAEETQSTLAKIAKSFAGISHGLTLVQAAQRKDICYEALSIAVPPSRLGTLHALLSQQALLRKIFAYLSVELSEIKHSAQHDEVDIASLRGERYFECIPSPIALSAHEKALLDHIVNKDSSPITWREEALNTISQRERQCIALMLEGKSADSSAKILGLSRRTVEYYLDNVKTKLGCDKKSDLINLLRSESERLGTP